MPELASQTTLVATAEFIDRYLDGSGFAAIVSIQTVFPRPSTGWTYDGTRFTAPVVAGPPSSAGLFDPESMTDLGHDSPSYHSDPKDLLP